MSDNLKNSERFEDVFQEEIVPKFTDMAGFRRFARSRSGLGLQEHIINEIKEDEHDSLSQKMRTLFKWTELNPRATCDTIRSITRKYSRSDEEDVSLEDAQPLGDSKDFYFFPDKQLGGRDRILQGAQKMHEGVRKMAVKILTWDKETESEADTLLKVVSHRNIVSFIGSGILTERFFKYLYIAMELCHDENLYWYVTNHREGFDDFVCFQHAYQLIQGLDYIHMNRITHRDLKPHNVLLSLDLKTLKIADFGVSKQVQYESTKTESARSIGTVGYKSPEVYRGGECTFKGDIYSLALVIFFIWSDGRHPFGDDVDEWNINIKKNKNRDFRPLQTLLPLLTKATDLLDQMMKFNPTDRPTTAEILNSWEFPKSWDKSEDWEGKLVYETLKAGNSKNLRSARKEKLLLFVRSSLKHSQSLCAFDPENDLRLQKIQSFDKDDFMLHCTFSTVAVKDKIWVIGWNQQIFVSKPTDTNSSWKKLDTTTIFKHGKYPAVAVIGGCIYIVGGGWRRGHPVTSAESEVFDTDTKKCEAIAPMNFKRRHHCLVSSEGCVFSIGGESHDQVIMKEVEKYDPTTSQWINLASLNTPRCKAAAASLNGVIYVLGGKDSNVSTLVNVECLDAKLDSNSWVTINDMNLPRRLFRACVCDSALYVIGGEARSNATSLQITIEKLDEDGSWKKEKDLYQTEILGPNTVVFTL